MKTIPLKGIRKKNKNSKIEQPDKEVSSSYDSERSYEKEINKVWEQFENYFMNGPNSSLVFPKPKDFAEPSKQV